ncbi:MAG: H+/Na+-translocating ferredoxin:NAD+ oxidoreductase subunit [Clostridiales bacterium]|nr:H+/Na+-translocating ferredoxin:NAD+ oxidoreductase subunit [Clostridiales bacterium]
MWWSFASKNSVFLSVIDGLGMGIGFTLALLLLGSIREILGAGTWFGMPVFSDGFSPAVIMILPPGGFITLGLVLGLLNKLTGRAE